MLESSRPELRILAIPILRCRGSNPSAPTGQSVSKAYGIGSRSKCHEMGNGITLFTDKPQAGGAAALPGGRTACSGLGDLDRVDRDLVGTRIVARVEIHLLTLAQTIDAGALQRSGMDEYILIPIVRPNEAEASLIVEEFHGS
jgi:hypothetical protein